jgi:hypothetical protein
MLLRYVPEKWVHDDSVTEIFFLHRVHIDSLFLHHLGQGLNQNNCGLNAKAVIFLRENQDINWTPNDSMNSWLRLVRVSDKDESSLCTSCGFTAYINLTDNEWGYVHMFMDSYALCDWTKSGQYQST